MMSLEICTKYTSSYFFAVIKLITLIVAIIMDSSIDIGVKKIMYVKH